MQDDEKRLLKELHVTGHNGSTMSLVFIATNFAVPLSYLAWKQFKKSQFMGDFTLIVIPCLLTLTYTWLAIGLSLIYILLAFVQTRGLPKQPTHKKTLTVDYTREISLDTPRALIHILTAIGILAVDFHIMPRYFIKCETYGQSMMDLGVAGFVFSSGIVAGPRLSNPASFVKTAKLIVPTALLGFGRAFVLKALNYQEHVTEYGVHWNFFMTLSSMPILASLQSLLIPFVPYWILALLIMLPYQYFLTFGNLDSFILDAPRIDFVSKNREGLFSLLGYYSIFLLAAHVGKLILVQRKTNDVHGFNYYRLSLLLKNLSLMGLVSAILWFFDFQISRRQANLAYVFFYSFVILFNVTIYFVIQYFGPANTRVPELVLAINRNQLAFFLAANLLTGLINMSIDTLQVSDTLALGILLVYILALCGLAQYLHLNRIYLKL